MVGGINPLPFLVAAWLVLTTSLLIPALLLPWRIFRIYTLSFIAAIAFAWYFSSIESLIIISIGATQAIAQLLGCWIYARKFRKATPRPNLSPARFSALLIVLMVATPLSFEAFKRSTYEASISKQLSLGKLVFAPRQLNKECDIVAWELKSQDLLRAPAPDWRATPYVTTGAGNINDSWLDGIGCSDAPTEIKNRILTLLNEEGSFYSKTAGILVSPKENIVVRFIRN